MAKHSGVVAHDPEAGITKTFHRLHDGDWAYQMTQDCQAIADANAEARNHCSPWSPSKEWKHVARVPLIFIEKWKRDYGLDFYSRDRDEQRRIDRLIETEFPWMRTTDGGIT